MWHAIGRQFRHPAGLGGRAIGYAMRAINRRPNDAAIAALAIRPGDCVLDLGCGPGAAIREIARRATDGTVYGVDQSQVMLDQAGRLNRAAVASGRVVLRRAGFEQLPFPDASIDKALAVNVAYFWADADAILAEIDRVLRPGGRLAIYVTDAAVMRRWKFAGPETHRLFDASLLRTMLLSGPFAKSHVEIASMQAGPGVPGLVALAHKPPANQVGVDRQNDPANPAPAG